MEEMVEKVARAICFACDASHISGLDIPERQARIVERRWQRHVPAARAAIEAMWEPSEAVLDAALTPTPRQSRP